jgi:hypothetical protein
MSTETRNVLAFGNAAVPGKTTVQQLEADFELMRVYLQMCVRKEDWHGVMDASADIREIVAKLTVIKAQ